MGRVTPQGSGNLPTGAWRASGFSADATGSVFPWGTCTNHVDPLSCLTAENRAVFGYLSTVIYRSVAAQAHTTPLSPDSAPYREPVLSRTADALTCGFLASYLPTWLLPYTTGIFSNREDVGRPGDRWPSGMGRRLGERARCGPGCGSAAVSPSPPSPADPGPRGLRGAPR